MRRRTVIYEGIGFGLLLLVCLLIFLSPNYIYSEAIGTTPLISWDGSNRTSISESLFENTISWIGKIFVENVNLGEMIFFSFFLSLIFILLIALTHLILVIVKRKPFRLVNTLVFGLCGFMFLLCTVVFFTRNLFINALEFDQSLVVSYSKGGLLFYISDLRTIYTDNGYLVSVWQALLIYFALLIYAVGIIFAFVGLVYDFLSIVSSTSKEGNAKKVQVNEGSEVSKAFAAPNEVLVSINNGPVTHAKEESLSNIPSLGNTNQPVLVQYISVPRLGEVGISEFAPGERVSLEEISSNLGIAKTPTKKQEEKKEETGLTADEIRMIIRQELSSVPEQSSNEEQSPSLNQIRQLIAQEISKSIKKNSSIKEKEIANIEENIKEDNEEIAKEEAPKRKVGEVNPLLPPHEKIIKIPFPKRMSEADSLMKSNYNELKSELLSYGVKSRLSNSGDTFRLHTVTFCKITIAGKSLKLYLALNPSDYKDAPFPVGDAGHKGTYKEIPLVFKVKSDLSLKRAKQLIGDVMRKNGLHQGEIELHNHAGELLSLIKE